jgi:hypothetical protein
VFNTGQANPSKIAAGSGATNVALTITTAGPNMGTGASLQRRADRHSPAIPMSLPLAGIVLAGFVGSKLSKHSRVAGLCVSLLVLGLLVACGGGGSTPPPPPTVTVTVTPNSVVSLYANEAGNTWPADLTQQQFHATVNNSTNQTVTWSVGSNNGTIDANTGLYTSPATVPNPATVTVTATAQAGGTPGTGRVNILAPTAVGTFPVAVKATEGATNHSQNVSLTVQ